MKSLILVLMLGLSLAGAQEKPTTDRILIPDSIANKYMIGGIRFVETTWKTDTLWFLGRPILFNFDACNPAWAKREPSGKDYLVEGLPKLYSRYEKECYADSTNTRVHQSNGQTCIVDWECIISSHWKYIWLHRQPTFSGFIEYLRGRNEQNSMD